MASTPRSPVHEVLPPHRFLREVFRHYLEYRDYVANGGNHVIEHSYVVHNPDGSTQKETISVSFWDLYRGLKELAPRKREAIFYNVILDQKQKDVAARMGITTVSVGQYVDAGCRQLLKYHFPELLNNEGQYDTNGQRTGKDAPQKSRRQKAVHEKALSPKSGGD